MKSTTKKVAIGTIFAAVAGYIAGILTAPKSGKETRQDIKVAAEHGMAAAEKQLKKLHTQMNELIREAKTTIESLKGTAQKEAQAALEHVAKAKEKVRDLLSSLHEGGAEDKELKKAIADANNAIDHLKTYLKK